MPLHLVGISRAQTSGAYPAESMPGSRGSASQPDPGGVRWIAEGELAAATVPPLPAATGPLEHAALLAAIHRHGDVLPVRFGLVLRSERAVRELLRRRREDFLHDLKRLRGTSEIGLRIELPPAPAPPEAPLPVGASACQSEPLRYLAARRARYQRQDQWDRRTGLAAEVCVGAVEGFYRDWRRLAPEPPGTVRLAFLVERRLAEAVARRLEALANRALGHDRTLLGPWPPYSFV